MSSSSYSTWATFMLLTSLNPWRNMPSVEAATFSAVAENAEVYFSNMARLSSKIRINKAAPTVLVTIIGAAILLTRCSALSKGRAINKMISICTSSAKKVIAPAVSGLKTLSVRPRRVSTLCTNPPRSPSTMVEIMQLSAVIPPIE
ncbi:hypothetical protein D3C73_1226790 [compost metagenome]